MKFIPYEHQTAGIKWIIDRSASALFWGMGTGKTVTTLTAIDLLLHEYLEPAPVLVIAPKRVAENTWTTECAKWEHLNHLHVVKMIGTAKERETALKSALSDNPADIYVINRENVKWLTERSNRWVFRTVVIDELSSFKNRSSERWKALRRVRGQIDRIIGLTGTPRPNGLDDLWAQIYLLDGGERLEKTLSQFRQKYMKPERMNGYIVYSWKPQPGADEKVYDRLRDICMSLRKDDVLKLPGQIYNDIELDPGTELLKKYKKFEREKVLECLDADGGIIAGTEAALTNKLLQFSNGAIYDSEHKVHELHTVKLEALEELVEQAGGESVLILYNYKHDAVRIMQRLPCRMLDTPKDISDWNKGKISVALAHPASIGHGLNLQDGGHIIIWFGLTWSLELYEQANERLNRPGQKYICIVYHLLLKGTHDERVIQALNRKEAGQKGAIEALRLELTGGDNN